MAGDDNQPFIPPAPVLYAFYALLVVILIATLAIVGAYI